MTRSRLVHCEFFGPPAVSYQTAMRRLALQPCNCSPLLAHIYEINLLYYFP